MSEANLANVGVGTGRRGWDIVVAFVLLHVFMSIQLSGLGGRRVPTVGDPMGLWGGLLFLLWGAAFIAAPALEPRSVLFRFLNRRGGARLVGGAFFIFGIWALAAWSGIV